MSDQPEASFPSTPARSAMPDWYGHRHDAIAQRDSLGRLSSTSAVHRELTATTWAIGRLIHDRQTDVGWGSRIIDRLSFDRKASFPDARGFSPRNQKYLRAFAHAWPEWAIVQSAAPLPRFHQVTLLENLKTAETRLWYAAAALTSSTSITEADLSERTDTR